ncbi:MAG: serine/threonine protein kinase, partial [Gemmatimonadota bacterium]|nr:serine/threonine protein kinase [Gemmatimonadota bacterium]
MAGPRTDRGGLADDSVASADDRVQTEIQHLRCIRDVFDRVVEEPKSEWRDIARSLAGDNDALFTDVVDLLAVYAHDAIPWENPRLLSDGLLTADLEARVSQLVGRYRLVRLLGRGGMGAVYEAVRADDEYDQRVAVKLVAPQFGAPSMASRFRRERQILASLEHRNIARILDGGTTDKGEPFFVMEYVEGKPITEYCDEHRLAVHDRLRLFLQVCAAAQHAHSKLIVHRDLKPANMLVASDGSVKLLDFGVAKLLGQTDGAWNGAAGTVMLLGAPAPTPEYASAEQPGDEPLFTGSDVDSSGRDLATPGGSDTFTQSGHPLTPEYASPEQLRDEPASVSSDVYSLGVVLYELLAGRRPFNIKSRTAAAALRALQGNTPAPSQAITATAAEHAGESGGERLRERLTGELDNVVRKAIRSDPGARYLSVEQLAADLQAYLHGFPVSAQPDTHGYRARKFVLRHVPAVTAACVATVAML